MSLKRKILLFSVLASNILVAQNNFTMYLGGAVDDGGRAVIRNDSNYIMAVCTRSTGAPYLDLMLVRTDTLGVPLYTKYYKSQMGDDPSTAITEVSDLCKTSDGNYAVTGWSSYTLNSPNGNTYYSSMFYIKTDINFNILVSKFYTINAMDGTFKANRIKSDGQGNIYITGSGNMVYNNASSFNITKIDEQTGNMIWSKNYVNISPFGTETSEGYDIEFLHDTNGNLIAGGVNSFNVFLFKLSPSGQVLWANEITTPAMYEGIRSIAVAANGSIICGGAVAPGISSGISSTMLMSVSQNGSLQWIKNFQGDNVSDYVTVNGINILPDGIYGAGTMSYTPSPSVWSPGQVHYFKTDHNGNLAWSYMFGDTANFNDEVYRTFHTTNNNWGFIGRSDAYRLPHGTYTGVIFVKPGSDGHTCNYSQALSNPFNDVTSSLAAYYSPVQVQAFTSLAAEENAVYSPYTTALYSQDICQAPSGIGDEDAEVIRIAPNPVHDKVNISGLDNDRITVRLYDADGKLVQEETGSSTFDVSRLPQGFFMLQVVTGEGKVYCRKLIKE